MAEILFCVVIIGIELAQSFTESVRKSSTNLIQDISFIIITKCSCDFIVRHVWTVSVLSPKSSKGRCIMKSKQSFISVLPINHVVVDGFLKHTKCEFPELR